VAAAHEGEGVDGGGHPVDQLLGGQRLGVEVAGSTGDGDEELGAGHLTGFAVVDREGLAGEELLSGPVVLAHDDVHSSTPRPIEVGELAVGEAVGVDLGSHDSNRFPILAAPVVDLP